MKVKHILLIVLILGIAAAALKFGLPSREESGEPELLRVFNGGSKHRFRDPVYAIADKKGRIFVADSGNHRVVVLDQKGKFIKSIGGPDSDQPLHYPYGLGILSQDRLLVADIQAGSLIEYGVKGDFNKIWYSGPDFEPAGIFVTSDRQVYVSDLAGKRILVFDAKGKVRKTIKPRDVRLDAPQGIWVNKDGTIWVADAGNYNVKLLEESGRLKTLFDGGPDKPLSMVKGLAVDTSGRIYVSDTLSSVIRVFDREGTSLATIGSNGSADEVFKLPVGLFIDEDDRVYIADQGNNAIQVWNWKSN